MKKILLILVAFFLFPTFTQAKLYQNYTHNFEINFANDWYEDKKEPEKLAGLITTRVNVSKKSDFGILFVYVGSYKKTNNMADLTTKQKDRFFVQNSGQLLKLYPSALVNYGQYHSINEYTMLIEKITSYDKKRNPTYIIQAVTILNNKIYTFRLVTTDDSGDQEKDLMNMLKTFKTLH